MDIPDITVDWLEDTLDIPTTTDGLMDLTMVLDPIFWEREKLKRRLPSLRPPRLLLDLPVINIPLVSSMDFPTPKDGPNNGVGGVPVAAVAPVAAYAHPLHYGYGLSY